MRFFCAQPFLIIVRYTLSRRIRSAKYALIRPVFMTVVNLACWWMWIRVTPTGEGIRYFVEALHVPVSVIGSIYGFLFPSFNSH